MPGEVEKIVSRKKRDNRSGRVLNELFCFAAKIFFSTFFWMITDPVSLVGNIKACFLTIRWPT